MRAIMVGAYGQGIQIGLQLLGVPIMVAQWGLANYGVWLALYSLPAYLAMADFGLTTAAANDMAMSMTKGDKDSAHHVFQALRLLVALVVGALFCIAAAVIFWPSSTMLDFAQQATDGHARAVTLILVVYGLVGLSNGTVNAGFRAVDRFAYGGTLYQTVFLIETSLLLGSIVLGATLFQAATVMIVIRVGGSAFANWTLRRQFPEFARRQGTIRMGVLRQLMRPALGSMILPFANATAMQGPVLLITSMLGAAAVPMYTTARTLTRFPLQLVMILSVATVTRFTVAHAADSAQNKARLVLLNLLVTAALLVPATLGVILLGQWVILHWTRGAIHTDGVLLALLAGTMLANGCWTVLSNFLIALNLQERFAYYYAASAVLALGLGRWLIPMLGIRGIGTAVLVADLLMLTLLISLVLRLGILNRAAIGAEAQALWRRIRPAAQPVS
ncbi:hypothetical protein GTZ99_13890 [Novosphingobium sp. FSY-8]|uniref:O-antigen/teichoic acid export membrane protein n=1 Tax=Novosphingobium ovatum TaxID=1908523 RepID=A0ABW9XGF8_9SPHN|nr:hypothetical protein [Novosphingobium ovatum]NBC37642.1 hypothetical protein [Novosphingobium ovatum]